MNKKILLYVKNNPHKDSRVRKITQSFLEEGCEVDIVGVCRESSCSKKVLGKANFYPIYVKKGQSKLGKLFELLFFTFALFFRSLSLSVINNYQLIYINTPPDFLIYPARIIRFLNPATIVSDIHDLSPEFYLSRFGEKDLIYKALCFFEKVLVQKSSSLIVTNYSYKRILIDRHQLDDGKLFIVKNYPNVSDYNIFKKAKPLKDSKNKEILLYLGAINPQDGVLGMVDSIKKLVNDRERKKIECWIVGEGEELNKLKSLVSNLGLEDHFKFWGGVWDRNRLASIVKSSDVCLEPAPATSLNQFSTFIKIFEYMLAEKPIVAYQLKETMVSAKNSSLFVDPDSEDFGQKILEVLNSGKLRKQLENNAVQVSQQLIWEYGPRKNLLKAVNDSLAQRTNTISFLNRFFIRVFDVIFSLLLLVLLSPLFLSIGLAVKISSPGPVIFKQERIGKEEELFTIYKFRTMNEGAEKNMPKISPKNPNVQRKDDPRITRIGQYLRVWSLDELPQLINVLKGEMSLVGPRPLIKEEVEYFPKKWLKRFKIKPGLTGLAQVSGRNNLEVQQAVRLDLQLIKNFNLLKYFKLLLQSFLVVISGKGAD